MEAQARFGIAYDLYFTMVQAGSIDLAATGDWTPATGDTKVSKDGGNVANTTNNPAVVGGAGSVLWKLTLDATEMAARDVDVQIVDSATKAVEDNVFRISTGLGASIEANKGIFILECDDVTLAPTTSTAEFFSISPTVVEEATASHFVGKKILITTGGGTGELSDVLTSSLANSKVLLTWTAMVNTLADTDRVVLL